MSTQHSIPWRHQQAAPSHFRDLGLWGEDSLVDIVDRHANTPDIADKTAIVDARVRWSYRELSGLSQRLARVLLDFGVARGDPVAAQLPSSGLLPALHLACARVGALFMPLSTSWRSAELGALLRQVAAPVLVVPGADPRFDYLGQVVAIRPALPALRRVLTARDAGPRSLESLAAAATPLSPEEEATRRCGPDEPVHVMCTSGTTGLPKASVWSSNDLITLLVHHMGRRFHLRSNDVAAGLAPANTGSTGYIFPVLAPLLAGGTAVLLEDWSPEAALDLIVAERCTYATAIPTQMVMLLQLQLESYDFSRFTRFNNAGAPLAAAVARDLEHRMGCRVQTVYGSTDGGVPVMTSIDDPDEARWGTVGRACAGEEVQLLGTEGRPVPAGESGEVCWRGANKSFGYLDQPDYEAAAWDAEGYFHSGDVGRFDEHGYLRIVGRIKDMILRGGTNIFPAEVEQLLMEHPSIAGVSIVGIPDDRLGERPCAVVVPAAGRRPRLDELCAFLGERGIASFKRPEELVIVTEIPRNAGGKVDKALVRDLAREKVAQS